MPSKWSLPCLVALLALPGLPLAATAATPVAQVRVAFDREAITASRATGVADTASGRAVSAEDPVRMASISKLAVAIAVMRMVEAGQLDLDADVSPLLGWTLRHPAHPDVPVSLRLLLSHTSGITDAAGYWQVPLDGEVRDLLADPRAWDAAHAPGGWFRYANLNFPLVAAVMERAQRQVSGPSPMWRTRWRQTLRCRHVPSSSTRGFLKTAVRWSSQAIACASGRSTVAR